MAELSLKPWQERPYGWFTKGYADGVVPVRVRSPYPGIDGELPIVINFNGLSAGHESMAEPSRSAVRSMGHAAVAFDYTNRGPESPLQRNTEDGLRILDALPDGKVRLLGLSMGGVIATKMADQAERPIESIHLVAPAGYINGVSELSKREITKLLLRELLDESLDSLGHPYRGYAIARDSLRNCITRSRAVPAELDELLHTTVYDDLRRFRVDQPNAVVVLAHGSHDWLVPREPLLESIAEEEAAGETLFDHYVPYEGLHTRLVHDSGLTEQVLAASVPDISRQTAA